MFKHGTFLALSMFFALSLLYPVSVSASLVGGTIKQGVRLLMRQGEKEVVEATGERAIRAGLKDVVSRYGDEAGDLVRDLGPGAMRVINARKLEGVKYLKRFGRNGLKLFENDPTAARIAGKFGDEGIRFCLSKPGIGKAYLKAFGNRELPLAMQIEAGALTQLPKYARVLQKPGWLRRALEILAEGSSHKIDKMLGVLERLLKMANQNKGILILGGATAYTLDSVMEDPDKYLSALSQGVRTLSGNTPEGQHQMIEMVVNKGFLTIGLVTALLGMMLIFLRDRRLHRKAELASAAAKIFPVTGGEPGSDGKTTDREV